jgi:hypothetical protein
MNIYRRCQLFSGVNDTGDKFFAGVINPCHGDLTKNPKILIFSKIREDIRELIFITGVNDTADKLFGGVSDTGD